MIVPFVPVSSTPSLVNAYGAAVSSYRDGVPLDNFGTVPISLLLLPSAQSAPSTGDSRAYSLAGGEGARAASGDDNRLWAWAASDTEVYVGEPAQVRPTVELSQ